MKNLKLNLLEKKEMNVVRGGKFDKPDCLCACAGGPQNEAASKLATKKGLKPIKF